MKRAVVGVIALVLAGVLVWTYVPQVRTALTHVAGAPSRPPLSLEQPAAAPPSMPSLHPVLERVSGAVVNISVEGTQQGVMNPLLEDPFFRHFFGDPQQQQQQMQPQQTSSVGSGVIIDAKNGYILTNRHVIADANHITVTLIDRRELEAKLVGADPEMDIAVLKVDADRLTAMPVGDSAKLKTGDFVIAMGNPFGLGQTATLGIVSALGRTGLGIEGYEDFIQTDASVNPGNSGGALIDLSGNLVGINTAILSRSGGNIGIGFAIPATMAMRAASQIIEFGKVQRGQIGVSIQDVTPELAQAMQIPAYSGALVSEVMRGSPAERAGIRSGDVITKLDGEAVTSSAVLRNRVGMKRPGDTVALEVSRGGQTLDLSVTLGDRQEKAAGETADLGDRFAGLSLGPIPDGHPLAHEVTGLYVESVDPGSNAARAGIQAGDIIVEINRQPVAGMEDLRRAAASAAGKPLLLHLRRGNGSLFVALK
jgi:Do/DeqQ family serine protease